MKKLLIVLFLVPAIGTAEAPPPPPMPAKAVVSTRVVGDKYQQKVTVRHENGQIIEEYRIKGQLRMVKITPKGAKPYFIYYNDQWTDNAVQSDLSTGNRHYWKLISW